MVGPSTGEPMLSFGFRLNHGVSYPLGIKRRNPLAPLSGLQGHWTQDNGVTNGPTGSLTWCRDGHRKVRDMLHSQGNDPCGEA